MHQDNPRTVVLATLNTGKVLEFQSCLNEFNIKIMPQSELGIAEIVETGKTFVENALIKARHAAEMCGFAAIADDSGLVVHALNGEPGIFSARYAGVHATKEENIAKLLKQMEVLREDDRDACFYTAIVFLRYPDDPMPIICEGRWEGKILTAPRGAGGFGYDPVFYDTRQNKTAAELTLVDKNKISHRGTALRALMKRLQSEG